MLFPYGCVVRMHNAVHRDAKNIVETKTYAYRYEYETEQNGEAITQYHEEKPTNTDYVEDTEENILYLQSKASML